MQRRPLFQARELRCSPAAYVEDRQPSIASYRFCSSSSKVSPWVAQPGIAGTSAQKPPSSASCTTIFIFILISSPECRAYGRQIQVLLTRQPYSAACAFTSADTWRMARASCSAGCAPDTAYFCANTNVGTPEMPLSEASLACAEISSTSSSVARRRRTSSASSPQSAAACTSTLVSVRSPPSLKYNSISRCFISADLPCASAQ